MVYKRFSLTKHFGFAWNVYSRPRRLSEYHTMHKYTNLFVFLYCLRSTQRLLIQWCKTLILRLKRQLDFTIAYTLETLDFTISYAWNITLYYISYAWNVRLYYPCQQYTNLFLFRFASEHFLTGHYTFISVLGRLRVISCNNFAKNYLHTSHFTLYSDYSYMFLHSIIQVA